MVTGGYEAMLSDQFVQIFRQAQLQVRWDTLLDLVWGKQGAHGISWAIDNAYEKMVKAKPSCPSTRGRKK